MEKSDAVAVVTGAARGIGRRLCAELADRGYRVAANDLNAPDDTVAELRYAGAEAIALPGDVSDEAAVRGMVETVLGEFGRIDALVNNAGISAIVPAEETNLADWNRTIAVNLTGPFLMCREFGKVMLDQGSGSIVNVSSVAGLLGVGDRAAYNASKHGLVGLTRTLAAEWGARRARECRVPRLGQDGDGALRHQRQRDRALLRPGDGGRGAGGEPGGRAGVTAPREAEERAGR